MGGGGRAGGTSGGVSLPGVLSRSGGVVGTSSALFLRDWVSLVGAVAAGFPAMVGWGHATVIRTNSRLNDINLNNITPNDNTPNDTIPNDISPNATLCRRT